MWRTRKHPGACHECRKRRLKCDETKPHCFKCQKYQRACTGYPDWSELAIRDMTAVTIIRSQEARRGSTSRRDSAGFKGHQPGSPHSEISPKQPNGSFILLPYEAPPIRVNPSASLNDQARSFLFSCFVDGTPQSLDPGYHHLFKSLFQLEDPGDCLAACTSAAALAVFSTRLDAKGVEVKTHKAYAAALSAVNAAIKEPGAADDDRILGSVLMLAFYEASIAQNFERPMKRLGLMEVLASMISARKRNAAPGTLAAHMYHLVQYELCKTSILGFATPSDADMGMWQKWYKNLSIPTSQLYSSLETSTDPESEIDGLIRRLMEKIIGSNPMERLVRREALPRDKESGKSYMSLVVDVIRDIMDGHTVVEAQAHIKLGSRPACLPSPIQQDWTYPGAYPDSPIYVYKSASEACFYMNTSLGRVSCISHMLAFKSMVPVPVDLDDIPGYRELVQLAKDDIAKIVGSVPYACGWAADGLHTPLTGSHESTGSNKLGPTISTVSFITWAMTGAMASPFATVKQREYLLHMLRYIADVCRIRQAEALLDVTAQATARSSLDRWHRTVLRDEEDVIPASWIGKGTSLESDIYRQQQMPVLRQGDSMA